MESMESLICPFTPTCPVYNAYQQKTGGGIDVILGGEGVRYSCKALEAFVGDCAEGGLVIPKDLREKFDDENTRRNIGMHNISCSQLVILNGGRQS